MVLLQWGESCRGGLQPGVYKEILDSLHPFVIWSSAFAFSRGPSVPLRMISTTCFFLVTVVRGQKVCAHEQEDEIGAVEAGIDLSLPFRTCADVAVVPGREVSLSLQEGELFVEVVAVGFVFVGIGVEEGGRIGGGR